MALVSVRSALTSWRPPTPIAALLDAVVPVYDELEVDSVSGAFLDEIRFVKERTSAPPQSLVCPAGASELAAAPTPIDGVWRIHHG